MTRKMVASLGKLGKNLCVWTCLAGLLLVLSPMKASAQANLAVNPSFELVSGSLPLNWIPCLGTGAGAETLALVTAPVDQGTRSLKVTVTTVGDVGVCSDPIAVSSGPTFRVSARSNVNN